MKFTVNSENYNPALPISQATAYNHQNAFTFILPLSEGREGEAWESSKKMMDAVSTLSE
jgi:hypothetical protein